MQNSATFQDPTSAKPHIPRSTLVSRNVTISGHRTSVRLEPEMWSGLTEICRREGGSLHEICSVVASRKGENTSLTAAIRVFVMAYYRSASTEDGHTKAGHGYGVATMCGNAPPAPQHTAAPPSSHSPSPTYSGGMVNRTFSVNTNGRGGLR